MHQALLYQLEVTGDVLLIWPGHQQLRAHCSKKPEGGYTAVPRQERQGFRALQMRKNMTPLPKDGGQLVLKGSLLKEQETELKQQPSVEEFKEPYAPLLQTAVCSVPRLKSGYGTSKATHQGTGGLKPTSCRG